MADDGRAGRAKRRDGPSRRRAGRPTFRVMDTDTLLAVTGPLLAVPDPRLPAMGHRPAADAFAAPLPGGVR